MAPESVIAPCVVRRPTRPQKLAGARIEPPVSDRTPAVRSGGRSAGDSIRRRRIYGLRIVRVLAHQREGQLVGLRLADESGSGVEQRQDRRRGGDGAARLGDTRRAAAAVRIALDLEYVLDGQGLPEKRSGS
jgi:hypothetical protein